MYIAPIISEYTILILAGCRNGQSHFDRYKHDANIVCNRMGELSSAKKKCIYTKPEQKKYPSHSMPASSAAAVPKTSTALCRP